MKDMNVSTETMTAKEIKSKLGFYFSIPELHGLSDPWNDNNRDNFLRLLNTHFQLHNEKTKVNFIFDFLNKKLKKEKLKIIEKLSSECFQWDLEDGLDRDSLCVSETVEGAKLLVEEKIEGIIEEIIETDLENKNKFKDHYIISSVLNLINKDRQEKIEFIIKNKDIYKGNLNEFININVIPIVKNEETLLKVPAFLKENPLGNYSVYHIKKDKIKELDHSFIHSVKVNMESNSIYLSIATNSERIEYLNLNVSENRFMFFDNNTFGTRDDAINELRKRIEIMEKSIEEMKKMIV